MKKTDKKIGIIGGAGPYASALLYEKMVQHCYSIQCEVPEIFLINYPFTRGLSHAEVAAHEQILEKELQQCVNHLCSYGATVAAIACNTLHCFLSRIDLSRVTFLHLPKIVLEEANGQKVQKLLVLGTPTTLLRGLYSQRGICIVAPPPELQSEVDQVIDHILKGHICFRDARLLEKIIGRICMCTRCDGIVLGCTELPVLHRAHPLEIQGIPIFDSIAILAKTIINFVQT